MKTAVISARVDPDIKAEAEATVAPLGLTLSQAINIFLHRLVADGGIPFDVRQPRYNADTEAAIAQGKRILAGEVAAKGYASFGDLLA
jgi:DNA-damage-inducible protein J